MVDVDGSNERLLTRDFYGDKPVCFSPDGKKILYRKAVADTHTEMWSANIDGSDTVLLSAQASPKFFLPDGSAIIFLSDRAVSGEYELYSMDLDGPDERQLTCLGGCISDPSCSSDGKHILFLFEPKGCPDRGKGDIYTMNADGSDLRKVGTNY